MMRVPSPPVPSPPAVSEVGICAAVLTGEYDLTSEPWPSISESAKDLVRRMLEMDISKRITAQEILGESLLSLFPHSLSLRRSLLLLL